MVTHSAKIAETKGSLLAPTMLRNAPIYDSLRERIVLRERKIQAQTGSDAGAFLHKT
jgi:hypothetical protein